MQSDENMLITFDVDDSCNVQFCGRYNENKQRWTRSPQASLT